MRNRVVPAFRFCCLLSVVVLFPTIAQAHSGLTQSTDFMNGALHPFLTPAHIVILIALGLLAGQRAGASLKISLCAFGIATLVSLALTVPQWLPPVYPPLLIVMALCLGGLVALDRPLPPWILAVCFFVPTAAIGLDSAVDPGPSTSSVLKILCGTCAGFAIVVLDLAFYVRMGHEKKWVRVGARVLGSWIVAISVLMIAFFFKKRVA
jgi:urease accessory protein